MGCSARNDGQDLPFGADRVDSVRSSASMASGVRSGRLIRASYALQSAASLTVGDPCCPGWWSTVRVDLADVGAGVGDRLLLDIRSEEHTSELQSLMRISYAVFCLKKKKTP